MRTRREQMASRRRSPSLDYLESRNLLSGTGSPLSEVARLPHVVPFVATETLTNRTESPPVNGYSTVTNYTTGKGSPLGDFTAVTIVPNEPNPPPFGVPFDVTGGTVTFTTAKGSSTLTGTFTSTAIFYTDPTTRDLHVSFTETIKITGGTGKFAGATGEIEKVGDNDATAGTGSAEDIGFISTARSCT